MNSEDKKALGWGIVVVLGVVAFLAILGWALGWFGLATQRPMAKYAEETRAQVYDTSRQYQQGTNRDLARYCREWRAAQGPAANAVADLIRSTADTYEGELTEANRRCLEEVGN